MDKEVIRFINVEDMINALNNIEDENLRKYVKNLMIDGLPWYRLTKTRYGMNFEEEQ